MLDSEHHQNAPIPNLNTFKIGCSGTYNLTHFFKGNIDELRIWVKVVSERQLRYMMNQEFRKQGNHISGATIPLKILNNDFSNLSWSNLKAYFPFREHMPSSSLDVSAYKNSHSLFNAKFNYAQRAPLPYISISNGSWFNNDTWGINDSTLPPNAYSIIDGTTAIDWNIVTINHKISVVCENNSTKALHLKYLQINESLTLEDDLEANSGHGLHVSEHLELNGNLILKVNSRFTPFGQITLSLGASGQIEKELEGHADLYTYDYWSSPIATHVSNAGKNYFSVKDILYSNDKPVNFCVIRIQRRT